MIIAERDGVILRHATTADLPRVDEITIICYVPIVASFIEIVGEECVQGIYGNPDFDWKARKTKQVRDIFQEHPDQVWVLEEAGYSVTIRAWDFRPGGNFIIEMQRAAEQAIASPLLEDVDLSGARGVLVNITSSSSLTLEELHEVMNCFQFAAQEATVIVGSVFY